jgi:hypothetical protein
MIDPSTLTIDTALECCSQYNPEEECGICYEALGIKPAESEDATVVQTKVCGGKHYFHRVCIIAWFRLAMPNLNICPLDRTVLFGSERVPQMPTNLPSFVDFPGHDVEEHEEFYANQPQQRVAEQRERALDEGLVEQEREDLDGNLVSCFDGDGDVIVDDTVD